jgi:hypothetical protein
LTNESRRMNWRTLDIRIDEINDVLALWFSWKVYALD